MAQMKIIMSESDWKLISDMARKEGYIIPHERNNLGNIIVTTSNITSYLKMANAGLAFTPYEKKVKVKRNIKPFLSILNAKEIL